MARNRPLGPIQVTLEECDGSFERMLRRFVRKVRDDGILGEVMSRRGYVKPCQRRRAKRKSPSWSKAAGRP